MKKKLISLFVAVLLTIAFISGVRIATEIMSSYRTEQITAREKSKLSHQQKVWMSALEWCESSGIPSKINGKDRDGTPSYYSFQFKPSTFQAYAFKYGLAEISDSNVLEEMKNYELTIKIVENMIQDSKVRWEREFPGCIKKIGYPPR